jgi:hypothetical protein
VNEDEFGWTCSGHGEEEEYIHGFGWEFRKKKTTGET